MKYYFPFLALILFSSCSGKEEQSQTPVSLEAPKEAVVDEGVNSIPVVFGDEDAFLHSVAVAVPQCSIQKGKNTIYAISFALAWNELKKLAGGPVEFNRPSPLAQLLNTNMVSEQEVSDSCYYSIAGFGRSTFQKARLDMKNKFGITNLPLPVHEHQLLVFAYLYKKMRFEVPFISYDKTLKFKGDSVKAFGHIKGRKGERAGAVAVPYYKNEHEFVVELLPEGEDKIILARIRPEETLQATYKKAISLRNNKGADSLFNDDDELLVPVFDFMMDKRYDELTGKLLKRQPLEGRALEEALQRIRFKLNEEGADLESWAMMADSSTAKSEKDKVKKMILDDSFLLILKEKRSEHPYFLMWVDNSELMDKQVR